MTTGKNTILFLNPPHELSFMRRYMCSYYSPEYLLPPHDLLSLATCVREWNGMDVVVLDAIAQKCPETEVIEQIKRIDPLMVVALVGIRIFGDDMACLQRIKDQCTEMYLVVFGYYPTFFPTEILGHSCVDLVLRREPEQPFSRFLTAWQKDEPVDSIPGLAGRRPDGSLFNTPEERLTDLDTLPFPDPSLVEMSRYEEAFMGGPCAALLSIRGCPFACNYCTTTYGRAIAMKSPARVVEEMKYLHDKGVKIIRFLDDIFTVDKERVIAICRLLLKERLQISWTCLSRVDTVDAEMLDWMRRAGCKRIMVGIESYSPSVLNTLNKGIDPKTINSQLETIRRSGIEVLSFFMVGAPFETEEDFMDTVRGVLVAPLNFITVNILEPFAITPYFDQFSDQIEFSLFPFMCRYKNPEIYRIAEDRRRRLYRRFYLRPATLLRLCLTFLRNPRRSLKLLFTFLF